MPAAVLQFDPNRARSHSWDGRPRPRGKRRTRSESRPRPLRRVVVLVVEDHDDTRAMLGQMLGSLGASVLLARDALAARVVLGQERPHVILLDLMLPGMDGLAFSRVIQGDPKLANIPIVAVTALAQLGDYIETWTRGFAGHLAKPVEEPALTDAVLRATGRR
jgi:CheY-like chemotaxis protein